MVENISALFHFDAYLASFKSHCYYLESVVSSSQQSLQEVFQSGSWNTNFEVNLLVLLCLVFCFELVILTFAWRKYSKPILEGKRLSQEEEQGSGTESYGEIEQSFSETILRTPQLYKRDMSMIKRFFEKKKLDRKFKKAGEGHVLNTPRSAPQAVRPASVSADSARAGPQARSGSQGGASSAEQQNAAAAALQRMSAQSSAPAPRTGKDAIKAQVKRELEHERKKRKLQQEAAHYSGGPQEVVLESAQVISNYGGVFFTCPLMPQLMLPKKEMDEKIKDFLTDQLNEDAEMASALLIHTVNKQSEKVKVCIETLCKYIDNLITNNGEEKFRKIRCGNKAFQDRVASLTGGTQFLLCAGYKLQRLPFQDGEDEFYVISEVDSMDTEKLEHLKEVLVNAEPITAELWRAERIFHCPNNTGARFGDLPSEFYTMSKEEIKREQQAKTDAVEKLGMLRTKAMKERDEIRELRRYRYTLIRIRFPGDIYLQGIFKSNETLQHILDFVQEHLEFDWLPFWISSSTGQRMSDTKKTLAELQLVPAVVVYLCYDKDLLQDAHRQGANRSAGLLKQSVMDRLENWAI